MLSTNLRINEVFPQNSQKVTSNEKPDIKKIDVDLFKSLELSSLNNNADHWPEQKELEEVKEKVAHLTSKTNKLLNKVSGFAAMLKSDNESSTPVENIQKTKDKFNEDLSAIRQLTKQLEALSGDYTKTLENYIQRFNEEKMIILGNMDSNTGTLYRFEEAKSYLSKHKSYCTENFKYEGFEKLSSDQQRKLRSTNQNIIDLLIMNKKQTHAVENSKNLDIAAAGIKQTIRTSYYLLYNAKSENRSTLAERWYPQNDHLFLLLDTAINEQNAAVIKPREALLNDMKKLFESSIKTLNQKLMEVCESENKVIKEMQIRESKLPKEKSDDKSESSGSWLETFSGFISGGRTRSTSQSNTATDIQKKLASEAKSSDNQTEKSPSEQSDDQNNNS